MAQENSSATAPVAELLREGGLWVTLGRFCQPPDVEEDGDCTRPIHHASHALLTTEQGGINWYWRGPDFSVQPLGGAARR